MTMPEAGTRSSQASPRTPVQKRDREQSPKPSPAEAAEDVDEPPATPEQDEASVANER